MRPLILLVVVLMSGCASVGEFEALNDIGLGEVREGISTYHKTMNVLGVQSKTRAAPTLNRGYGHLKNMRYKPRDVNDVPYVVRDIKELGRYVRF